MDGLLKTVTTTILYYAEHLLQPIGEECYICRSGNNEGCVCPYKPEHTLSVNMFVLLRPKFARPAISTNLERRPQHDAIASLTDDL